MPDEYCRAAKIMGMIDSIVFVLEYQDDPQLNIDFIRKLAAELKVPITVHTENPCKQQDCKDL
jgi:hypothetical protein